MPEHYEAHLLLADDDIALNDLLAEYLVGEGFRVTQAYDGDAALTLAQSIAPDVIVLDIMMPRRNGLDVLRALRTAQDTPVIMLTAKGDEMDQVVGLEIGADDYLSKPCSPRHLVARIRALLRRSQADRARPADVIAVDDLVVAKRRREVLVDGVTLALTSSEFQLLQALAEHAGDIVDKQRLSQLAFGRPLQKYDRSLDMHMSNLRKKLPLSAQGQERIQTVRGIGYQLIQLSEH